MEDYARVAWCTEFSPNTHEYFEDLALMGVEATVNCLHISGAEATISGAKQTMASRTAGLVTNAFAISELLEPELDAQAFIRQLKALNYYDTRVALMPLPYEKLTDVDERINRYLTVLSTWCGEDNIDVCLDKKLVDDQIVHLGDLPADLNLTVSNPRNLNAGVDCAGTWIYDNRFSNVPQLMAYDFFDFYTSPNRTSGFQLDLTGEYVARLGDNWWIVAQHHGMQVIDLLELNNADIGDRIMPGQHIKVM